MNVNDFRKGLMKIMPGYNWTVHRNMLKDSKYLSATGVQSSGFNRLSTLQVVKREKGDTVEYEVKSSGFGASAPWLSDYTAETLARSLRGLQDHYETMASTYSNHAMCLKGGREINN